MKTKEPYSEERAMQYALRSLGRRMQSRAELERKLLARTTPEVARSVLARLLEWGYLDDRAFAEAFVRSRRERWGALRLRAELARRGVDERIVGEVLAEGEGGEGEVARALALLVRSAWRHKGEHARMVRFLQARGFALTVAVEAAQRFEKLREDGETK
ncbi:regulatory protein RecX [Deinococcota bacterium DY0809b]